MTKQMTLAISNIAWSDENDKKMYEFLNNNSINYLEIAPTRLVKEKPYDNLNKACKIKKDLKENYNLKIISMQSVLFGETGNIFTNEEVKSHLKKAIDFASKLDINNIVFGCPKNRNINNISENKIVNTFKELSEYAKNRNVILSLEANPKIYNTNFINTTKEALDFVKLINIDSLKVNLDLGTIIENDEDIEYISKEINLINHVHISMPYLKEIDLNNDKLIKLMEKLKENNYNKCISIEMGNINNIKKTKEILLKVRGLL